MRKATDNSSALALIENAMKQAQRMTENAANEHLQAFKIQMREKVGVDEITLNEPYLPFVLARSELKYLRRMERLKQRLISVKVLHITIPNPENTGVVGGNGGNDDEQDTQAVIDAETNRANLEAKQDLDAKRQPAFGINQYVWEGGDCPLCAPNDGQIFTWGEGEEPGSVHPNCNCSAEPVLDGAGIDDPPIEPVYPIEALAGLLAGGGLARALGRAAIARFTRGNSGAAKPFNERPNNVPKDWEQSASRNEKGVRYRDPENPHNEVRLQKGDPNSDYKNSQEPYARWKKDGQWLDKDGKPSNDPEKTHIPLEDFKFDPEIFK